MRFTNSRYINRLCSSVGYRIRQYQAGTVLSSGPDPGAYTARSNRAEHLRCPGTERGDQARTRDPDRSGNCTARFYRPGSAALSASRSPRISPRASSNASCGAKVHRSACSTHSSGDTRQTEPSVSRSSISRLVKASETARETGRRSADRHSCRFHSPVSTELPPMLRGGASRFGQPCENHYCKTHMKDKRKFSRRLFAAAIAGSAAALAQPPAAAQVPPAPGRRPQPAEPLPFAETLVFTRKDAAFRTTPFPMSQVRLLAGPCRQAADYNRAFLMRTMPDRLLHTFRLNAGLPSSAQPLGGWEEPGGELRGHVMGHYLSACALRAASAGDSEMKARGDQIVAELARCQKQLASGGIPERLSSRVLRPPRQRQESLGAVLHLPQDPGGHARHVLPCRQQAGARSRQRHGSLGGRVERSKAEAHMQDVILRNEFGGMSECPLQPGRRHQRRPVGEGWRPIPKEGVHHAACATSRRIARASHEHARSAGDRRRPPL